MKENDNLNITFPTNQNNNNKGLKSQQLNSRKKRVKWNEKVEIYDIESYKELNKLLTYDVEEGLKEYLEENPNYKLFGDNHKGKNLDESIKKKNYNPFGNFSNPNAMRRNIKNECCCILF